MTRIRLASLLLLAALLHGPATASAPQAFTPHGGSYAFAASGELLNSLPPALREAGSAILNETSEAGRAKLVWDLAKGHPADSQDFLIALLEREDSEVVRAEIVGALGARRGPKVWRALERRVESDAEPSDRVAALAFRTLVGDRGYTLPGPLSLGSVAGDAKAVRVLAFGDFGSGSRAQRELAADMLAHHRERPFDLGLTVGDNFYPSGLSSPVHRRWRSQWEDLYTPLGIEFYAILGNHDTRDAVSPFAQVLRSKRSASWRMPAPYYTYLAGPAQFFALDTNEGRLDKDQLAWLEAELKKSAAAWKVVYGHHPLKSDGEHGDDKYTRQLYARLLPVLQAGGADVYLAGHDHDMQYLKPEGGLNLFISGGGGKGHRALRPAAQRLWGQSSYGFTVLEAEGERLAVEFVGAGGKRLCRVEIRKGGATTADCP